MTPKSTVSPYQYTYIKITEISLTVLLSSQLSHLCDFGVTVRDQSIEGVV